MAGPIYQTAAFSSLPSADFNQDHSVDRLDLDYWMHDYSIPANSGGSPGGPDGFAFLLWQQQLGDATTADLREAPEPSTLAIWAIITTTGAAVLLRRRATHRSV